MVSGIEVTSVPGAKRPSVPGPFATTSPTNSWPKTMSRSRTMAKRPPERFATSTKASVYFAACRSEPQMPQARVRTSTWPSARTGSGIVSTTKSPWRKTAARMMVSSGFAGG